ncbi:hypothetical protein [Candidatus Viridilinea mediisalina]|uniref:hypothetical protein n=1 Tax=Candidatus Viridilinea mediisalina TaxID=2024553 RepID=UPI0013FD7DC5|nr:hypothetical protein [Candidatus Viridilinea mediisalina]
MNKPWTATVASTGSATEPSVAVASTGSATEPSVAVASTGSANATPPHEPRTSSR